jgi:hypothetical protein
MEEFDRYRLIVLRWMVMYGGRFLQMVMDGGRVVVFLWMLIEKEEGSCEKEEGSHEKKEGNCEKEKGSCGKEKGRRRGVARRVIRT